MALDHSRLPVEADEDVGVNTSRERCFAEIAAANLSRRQALRGIVAGATLAGLGGTLAGRLAQAQESGSTLTFAEIMPGPRPDHAVAPGYSADILIRWGDGVLVDAPKFDVYRQAASAQSQQFGYNNDFVAYLPLPLGSSNSENGLLWVNHEYTELHMMFPGLDPKTMVEAASKEMIDIELTAMGGTVVEVRKAGNRWRVVEGSRYARRITAANTAIRLTGPAAGHPRLRTSADATGTTVVGTLNNCGGGVTPWGTVLSAEENFNGYFAGDVSKTAEARNYRRYGFATNPRYGFARFHDRFHVEKEPNEGNRFGWIVEIDPYDPNSVPVKRTALGRFKHEAATTWINPDGTVTIYSGDDERNEYIYKFVTRGRYSPNNRAANRDLLDEGTLYVAQFHDDGTVKWLPLKHGEGPLTAANGFDSQADVLIETRRAADLLKATPMDRPEDIETNPVTGRTFALLTNNSARKPEAVDKANPRANNLYGQIIELIPPGEARAADHTALEHRWEMFLVAGPLDQGGRYGPRLSAAGWLACPDNIAFDNEGRIWITSDQGEAQSKFGIGDGVWAADTTGPARATTRFFYRTPTGAEMCGPCFTPDNRTLFVAVQHPASDDPGSTFDKPSTRWPDFSERMPPRPSVIAIVKNDGRRIGT
jgi:uncharacterized protein